MTVEGIRTWEREREWETAWGKMEKGEAGKGRSGGTDAAGSRLRGSGKAGAHAEERGREEGPPSRRSRERPQPRRSHSLASLSTPGGKMGGLASLWTVMLAALHCPLSPCTSAVAVCKPWWLLFLFLFIQGCPLDIFLFWAYLPLGQELCHGSKKESCRCGSGSVPTS